MEDQLIKREDIEYKKLLLFQLNDIRVCMSEVFKTTEKRKTLKTFIASVETLKSLLHPYLNKELKAMRLDIEKINIRSTPRQISIVFRNTQESFEKLMNLMDKKNLLLEEYYEDVM